MDPVSAQVQTTLFRGLVLARFVVAAYAVALNALRWRDFEHPVVGWVVVGVIVVWSFAAAWAYDSPRRRTLPLLVVDLLVTVGALLSTRVVESPGMLARNASTVPSFWVLSAVLAWAIVWGWRGGLAVAVLMSVADLSVREQVSTTNWGNIFLLLLAAGVVGYSTNLIREATEARSEAERIAAVLAERARLARAVHDGVLQVLALVRRRGVGVGGEAEELAQLAGEQEVALRALVQGSAAPHLADETTDRTGTTDLTPVLARLASRSVTVSGPAGPILLPGNVVAELTSAVGACLDNVTAHVGVAAPAWVLVEELDDAVLISVRDEGPGIAAGRLEQAGREGRLGVSHSIRGRMTDLGGSARLVEDAGQGTEWELSVPTLRR